MNRMKMHHVSLSYIKHTNHRHISLTETDFYMYSVWEKIILTFFNIQANLQKSHQKNYISGTLWVLKVNFRYNAWQLILYHCTILFLFPFFLLLRSPRDKFYNLKHLIQFNYNPPLIIITIFQTESFHLFNWKVSQLKCISFIKLTSALNTLFLLEWNFFQWENCWNEWRRQCTKSSFIVLIFISMITLVFLFHFFAIWLSVKFQDFFIIKTLFQILHFFVLL